MADVLRQSQVDALLDGFGRNFGVALSSDLRTKVEVSIAHIAQLAYGEFIHSLPNPTCLNLLSADQLDRQLCLEISPMIVYPIIDRLLGGSNADLFIPQRPLTQIERRLVQRVTDRAMHFLSEAWSNLTPIAFKVDHFESNPRLVQIVPANETVVVVTFELKIGNRFGTMSLCIPYKVIETTFAVPASQNGISCQPRGSREDQTRELTQSVHDAPVEVRALLAQTTIRANDLMSLQVGDVITTEKGCDQEVLIQVQGKTFLGQICQFRGKRAVRITSPCHDADAPADGGLDVDAMIGAPE